MTALLFALSAISFLLAIYSFVIFPLTLKWLPKKPLRPAVAAPEQKVSICVCAYNEAKVIREKLENLRALQLRYPGTEVLVYVDCASDETGAIVSEYKDHFFTHIATERHGKTYGMNLLVGHATNPLLVFSDANVILALDAIEKLAPYFADPEVGCVVGHLHYINADDGVTAASGSLYWRMEEKLKQRESDAGSAIGADGSIFAIRRSLHHKPPADIIDDMFVSLSILCDGYRIVRADDVNAYEKTVSVSHEEFRRKVRIACQSFNVHRLLWPRLKTLPAVTLYQYIAHKFLRWFTAYWLAFAALFFVAALCAAGLGWLALLLIVGGLGGLYLGYRARLGIVMKVLDILTAFGGVGYGIYKSLRGERFQTWAPAQSIRDKIN